ncbi:MAG: ferritin family protein [Desulfuromonadales bacterium]|nr:ferritin family protein [Desulfuromonadales bacterium]NIR34308.1 ferritin family protein [Desulfuromonadales bacterium]NIS44283.1 ferritin family protein [Desulfuromonadales bacterium]
MPQEFNLQEALKMAAQTEKAVMYFYKRAAEVVQNPKAKKVFETLAADEREHAEHFFPLYKGDDLGSFEEFISAPPHPETAMIKELEKAIDADVHERKAMEIALREEEDLERNLEMTAKKIIDPLVRRVFEQMAKETRNHYEIIESEYAHLMGMVHETDIDTYVRE